MPKGKILKGAKERVNKQPSANAMTFACRTEILSIFISGLIIVLVATSLQMINSKVYWRVSDVSSITISGE